MDDTAISEFVSLPIIIFLSLLILSLLLSIALNLYYHQTALAQTIIATTNDFLTYENNILGIKIQYPSDWYNSKSDDGSIRLQSPLQNASDMFLEQVTMSSHNITLCGNTSPQYDILNRMIAERIKSGVNLKIEESKTIVLNNGNAANKLVYTFFDPKYGMLKGQDIVIIKSNKMYSIQYYAQSHNN
jgi:PsbP-like protein